MRTVDIIQDKRDGKKNTREEIEFLIKGYVNGEIPDYQVSAWLMAIYFNGMDETETATLVDVMLHSGDTIDLSSINGITIDKHSTGGVGDKTSLVVLPICANLGLKVAKMSGRGLGHTGGTIDKLESVPGFDVSLDDDKFFELVKKSNMALIGQTKNLVPADKLLYALRDVTATVDSIPLIASSIMSKKIASGADNILLDVKVGSGAFMKDIENATLLAETMVKIGKSFGKNVVASISDMDQPLGNAVGNALEVMEAKDTLLGHGPSDFTELCIGECVELLQMTGYEETVARKMVIDSINDGSSYKKFLEFLHNQGGDETLVDKNMLAKAKEVIEVKADKEGYISAINAENIGIASMILGGGRETKNGVIDMAVGIVMNKKKSDHVNVGETLAYVHTNGKNTELAIEKIKNNIEIGDEVVKKTPIIIKVVK